MKPHTYASFTVVALLLIAAGTMRGPEPTQPQKPIASKPLVSVLSESDKDAYHREIKYLKDLSDLKSQGGAEMQRLGVTDSALQYHMDAVTYIQSAQCLEAQRKDAVPFYEAKHRCNLTALSRLELAPSRFYRRFRAN